jgi:MSHA pilin protein MshD
MCIDLASVRAQRGLSLIELIIFIVVVSIGLAGVLLAINTAVARSADPLIRKQALAAAESLLEEIELQPFTYCDPGDSAAPSASGSVGCTTAAQSMDNPANWGVGKARYGPVFFDNVADYNGFTMTGTLNDILQQSSSQLSGYNAAVSVTQVGTGFGLSNNADALRIDVTVTGGGNSITLTGFRFRHSPNLAN